VAQSHAYTLPFHCGEKVQHASGAGAILVSQHLACVIFSIPRARLAGRGEKGILAAPSLLGPSAQNGSRTRVENQISDMCRLHAHMQPCIYGPLYLSAPDLTPYNSNAATCVLLSGAAHPTPHHSPPRPVRGTFYSLASLFHTSMQQIPQPLLQAFKPCSAWIKNWPCHRCALSGCCPWTHCISGTSFVPLNTMHSRHGHTVMMRDNALGFSFRPNTCKTVPKRLG
jgi:hypothetical protein